MHTLSITIRYRPVRIGWCIRVGDKDALRKALRASFSLWGGRYNPVIPVDDSELASDLIRFFRVDALWPISDDQTTKDFAAGYPYLPNPFFHESIFIGEEKGRKNPIMVDIYHPLNRLYEDHFRNNPNPEMMVEVHTWESTDPLSDILLATFGALPTPEETGTDYIALMTSKLRAKDLTTKNGANVPQVREKHLSVSMISSAYLERHHSYLYHNGQPGFYLGSADDFDDVVNFWNLRAADNPLVFLDPNHSFRLEARRSSWLEILKSRPQDRRWQNPIVAWSKNGDSAPALATIEGTAIRNRPTKEFWHNAARTAPYIYMSENRVLASVEQNSTDKPSLSFQLPPKPLAEDSYLFDQHLVAAIDPGIGLFGNERSTLHTPFIPELNEFYGRNFYFHWNQTRVEPEGLGIIIRGSENDLTVRSLDVTELIRQIFSFAGIKAEPSKPGLIALRVIHQMGGIQGCRVFKIAGVRKLIEEHGPQQSFRGGLATKTIYGENTENPLSSYDDLVIEYRPIGSKLTCNDVFAFLLKKEIFRAGLSFECPSCQLAFWVSIDDVRTKATCEYCGHQFVVTPLLKDRDWAYRRSGLFGRDDHQEGAIPVALTLQQIDTMHMEPEFLYTTAMALKRTASESLGCETDFVALISRPNHGRIEIAIGECKTRKTIDADDIAKLKSVADSFPSGSFTIYIVFAKLSEFSKEEIELLKRFRQEQHYGVILMTAQDLEPYYPYYRREKPGRKKSIINFEDMVVATEEFFFK